MYIFCGLKEQINNKYTFRITLLEFRILNWKKQLIKISQMFPSLAVQIFILSLGQFDLHKHPHLLKDSRT